MSIHVVIPAGGTGSRFGGVTPKQFLPLCGRTVLEWSVLPFLRCPAIAAVWVALGSVVPADVARALHGLAECHPGRLHTLHCAGDTRALTVAAALQRLSTTLADEDWVLVHDAARPGLDDASLGRLLEALAGETVGALLALPVADTLKRAAAGDRVETTVAREGLWQAQTPQAFRLALLREALQRAGPLAGDEASAVEALGLSPRLVAGDPGNFKLTRPGDGALMAAVLAAREAPCA